ncbi:MAG: 2-phospho-L-lactate guanylyltransferase [Candidatus Brocadiae bacterium]|nr:2-phospho-L-lactate guanylyltransferase [Candidatus Brocadiia bacterium]
MIGGTPSRVTLRQEGLDVHELVFQVTQESDGGYTAECLSEDIFTQADTWEELRQNAMEAVRAYYFDSTPPERIRLHLVRDEVVSPK